MPDSLRGEHPPAPDQADRDAILSDLDTNLLVEAAAGTGKTTSMVHRMVELLARGKCGIENLAVVTFTRKAAAELRTRFQAEVEKAAGEGSDRPSVEREKLAEALVHLDTAFIGTIHSFCGRLLRERPVEAEVDIEFREIDKEEDEQIRLEAWDLFVAEVLTGLDAEADEIGRELRDAGLWPADLGRGFTTYAGYPDVEAWPAPEVERLPLEPAVAALEAYARHMKDLVRGFGDAGNDKLMPLYEQIPRMVAQNDIRDPAEVLEVMECFKSRTIVQKCWPGGQKGGLGKKELERWKAFTEKIAEPFVQRFLKSRYAPVMRAYRRARWIYDHLRAERGVLNFQDLLMRAAALLRSNPHVRAYFSGRFTRLLVDEFQDTDPIQAEVILLLTAGDHHETDWKKCAPVPGALFVVGDPKQSIYRFRRADIVTYNEVKDILKNRGGRVVSLTANFRTVHPVRTWVNTVFNAEGVFPAEADRHSPTYVPLDQGRIDGTSGPDLEGVAVMRVPKDRTNQKDIRDWESETLARIIRHHVDTGMHVPRTRQEVEKGVKPAAGFGDFLVLTRNKAALGTYGRALQVLGIPHQVSGGHALNEVPEIALLHRVLEAALMPEDPVALVALLRSDLFGISDEALYAFRRAGGRFHFRSGLPDSLDPGVAGHLEEAFQKLKGYAGWLLRFPPVPAMEKIAADLGLFVRAAGQKEGNSLAGGLARALEILRAGQAASGSAAEVAAELGKIAAREEEYDGLPARPSAEPVVRVMNLHKAKGLEAPVVFLADPYGKGRNEADVHIDRSGEKVLGYLRITATGRTNRAGFASKKELARPPGWEDLAKKEKRFLEAEEKRLLYVAATRAGSRLVVVQSNKKSNPWEFFGSHLQDVAEIQNPGEQAAPFVDAKTITAEEVDAAGRDIATRWDRVRARTYATMTARKAPALPGAEPAGIESPGDAGALPEDLPLPGPDQSTGWGTVIHALLETAVLDPARDLTSLAHSILDEEDIDRRFAKTALHLVESVVRSAVWERARKAKRCLAETPLQVLLPEGDARAAGTPTLLKGTVDLVFEEADGWVIVDWKTDRTSGKDLADAAGRYAPQLAAYRDAWERSTGERVVEAGIYFVMSDEYVVLTGAG